jgi:hypothetical protein
MNARARHPAGRGIIPPGPPHDDTISADSPVRLGPACCCPANPVVRVIMPAAATRAGATELLLCGHHYRASRQALADANATVTELLGPAGTPPEALLPGLPSPRVPVS